MDHFDDFSLVTKLQQQNLTHLLVSIPGKKDLIVETTLLRPLDRICSMSMLRSYNCVRVQQLCMEGTIVSDEEVEHHIFFVRPTIPIARKLCELIRSSPGKSHSVIQVGNRRNFFIRELEKNGLHGLVDLHEFNLSLVCLESDLFSMELPQHSPDLFSRYFNAVAKTLWQLQTLYGQIQITFGIGECFPAISKEFQRICAELGEPSASADQFVSHLFLFDRRTDLASVLLTGLTYESILNDVFTYNCGKISFGEAVDLKMSQRQQIPGRSPPSKISKVHALNNSDPIFSSIRNSHMTAVFPFLSARAKFIQSSFERISTIKKIDEMKNFVSNEFGSLKEQQKQLEIHICACEYLLEKLSGSNQHFAVEQAIISGDFEDAEVQNYLLKMIATRNDQWRILLLASLWSLRGNGIPTKHYRQFQEAFLHRYGFEQMTSIYQLRKNGLLFESDSLKLSTAISKTFERMESQSQIHLADKTTAKQRLISLSSILKGFRLSTPENMAERRKSLETKSSLVSGESDAGSGIGEQQQGVNSLAFVFSDAYIPLISYLVERTVTKGWDEQHLKKVLGEQSVYCTEPNAKAPDNRIRRAILVCFVGGVTYAEIASLRCFAQNRDFRLIILTTHIIHRENFLRNCAEFVK